MTDTMPSTIEVVGGFEGPVLPIGKFAGELDRRRFNNPSWPQLPITLADNHTGTAFIGPIDRLEVLSVDDIAARIPLTDQQREDIGDAALYAWGRFGPSEESWETAGKLAFWGRLPVSVEVRDGEYVETPIVEDGVQVGREMDWSRTVIGAVAVERLPAFAGAFLVPSAEAAAFRPDDEEEDDEDEMPMDDAAADMDALLAAVTDPSVRQAAVGPDPYPARMFTRLTYSSPTRLTIAPDGEVTGHVAVWGRRYRQQGGGAWVAAKCGDLSEWLVSAAHLDDGSTARTGVIVSDALHQWGPTRSDRMREQIENTSLQVMQVAAWEDEHGIAVHGSTLPGVTPQQAARAMAGCPSIVTMDQRDGRGFLPVGVLMVNTCGLKPGDAVVRVRDGEPETRVLAASTAGAPDVGCGCGGTCGCGQGVMSVTDVSDADLNGLRVLRPAVLQASADEQPPEPPPEPRTVDVGALARLDEEMRRKRLRAAVVPKK